MPQILKNLKRIDNLNRKFILKQTNNLLWKYEGKLKKKVMENANN